MLKDISKYRNRQVIINEYEDEELIRRDGFMFEDILVESSRILFLKNTLFIYEFVLLNNHIVRKDKTFPNFYVIESGSNRTEIYFP